MQVHERDIGAVRTELSDGVASTIGLGDQLQIWFALRSLGRNKQYTKT
jgi:hypothetical protein